MNQSYLETIFPGCNGLKELPQSFAIITACNPMDEHLPKSENENRNQKLLSILGVRGKTIAPIIGSSPDRTHQEPSFLAHCSRKESIELGKMFRQRAIFWVNEDKLEIIECSTGLIHFAGSFRERTRIDNP